MNHGSEQFPKSGRGIVEPYVNKGYVVFFPHRRGQGCSSDRSEYIMARELDWANKPHKLLIFPAFGTTHFEGHGFGVWGEKIWGDEVFSFLARVAP
jgi:hypothetical protein